MTDHNNHSRSVWKQNNSTGTIPQEPTIFIAKMESLVDLEDIPL